MIAVHIPGDHLAIKDDVPHILAKGVCYEPCECTSFVALEVFTVEVRIVFGLSRPEPKSSTAWRVRILNHVKLHTFSIKLLFNPKGIVIGVPLKSCDQLLKVTYLILKLSQLWLEALHQAQPSVFACQTDLRVK